MTLFHPAAATLPAAMTSANYPPKSSSRITKIGRTGVLRLLCHRKIGPAAIGPYAHYKLFAETQIDWMEEQKKFTWKDKWPVSARITIIFVALALVVGLALWIARANFCA